MLKSPMTAESSRGVPGSCPGEVFITSIESPTMGPPLGGPPGPLLPGPGPMGPIPSPHMSPDIEDFIIGYIPSPGELFESCGLGMMGVFGPGPCEGGQPIGPYPPGDIPGTEVGGQGGLPPIGGIIPGGGGPLIGP
jgi:hypothetical protein